MGGFFGTISKHSCSTDLFYGTDYNSHLGTKRGGMATYDAEKNSFSRVIHNLESTYFRTKFESELPKFSGNSGIGIISDTDPQPIILNSHLGRFAIVTVAKITNTEEIVQDLLAKNMHFGEQSTGTNQTELVALLIIQGKSFVEGIENVFKNIKGSCSMLLLTEDGIICARDQWGRTPIIIGKKDGAYAATSESSAFPNLDYEIDRYLGPGEIIRMRADGIEHPIVDFGKTPARPAKYGGIDRFKLIYQELTEAIHILHFGILSHPNPIVDHTADMLCKMAVHLRCNRSHLFGEHQIQFFHDNSLLFTLLQTQASARIQKTAA